MRISALVPGVDRAQRLRPRHHADRAVRVDDRDDDLPAQPRAGQAPRRAARAARHPARRPERRDAPSLRFRLAGRADRADRRSSAARPRSARRARATEESIIFQVDEDFTIPPARPAPTCSSAAGRSKDVGLADGEARPQGSDQLAVRHAAAVGDALYLGFEEPLGRLLMQVDVDASQARGAGVNPEDPPLRWEVSQGDGRWEEAIVLEDLTGGFNYGSGTVELELPPRSAIEPRRRPPPALAALPDRRPHAPRRRGRRPTRSRRRSTRSPPAPIGARLPVDARLARSSARCSASSDGTPGQIFPLRHRPVLKPAQRRDARGPGPRVRRLGALGAARGLRRLDRVRPPLRARPRVAARSSSAPRSARPTAAGRSTARCRPRARCCASPATATAAAARATSRRAR